MTTVHHKSKQYRWILILSSLILGTILGITVYMTLFHVKKTRGALMVQEVAQLADIFKKIHQTAVIQSFDAPRSAINFLNVKSFAGSEVGPLNLLHPDKWQGPYLPDNLTMQTKEYELVRAKDGKYYIVPGEGVTLPNGKIVGKDISFDENTDFVALMQKDGDLNFEGRPMAAVIDLLQGSSTPAELAVEAEEE